MVIAYICGAAAGCPGRAGSGKNSGCSRYFKEAGGGLVIKESVKIYDEINDHDKCGFG